MDSTTQGQAGGAVKLIRKVKRVTRRKISAEDKIRIVLEGFRKELPVTDLCRREKISTAVFYSWLKQFMEAGKARLRGNTLRDATQDEVSQLREENQRLKELAGEQALELGLLKMKCPSRVKGLCGEARLAQKTEP